VDLSPHPARKRVTNAVIVVLSTCDISAVHTIVSCVANWQQLFQSCRQSICGTEGIVSTWRVVGSEPAWRRYVLCARERPACPPVSPCASRAGWVSLTEKFRQNGRARLEGQQAWEAAEAERRVEALGRVSSAQAENLSLCGMSVCRCAGRRRVCPFSCLMQISDLAGRFSLCWLRRTAF
jgi:hypothetical protein